MLYTYIYIKNYSYEVKLQSYIAAFNIYIHSHIIYPILDYFQKLKEKN